MSPDRTESPPEPSGAEAAALPTTRGPRPDAHTTVDGWLLAGLRHLFGLPAADLKPDADLEGDLHLDSLAVAELHVWVEDALDVRIAAAAHQPAPRTLGDVQQLFSDAVARRTGSAASGGRQDR